MYTVLTIAGDDPSGGADIQVDLETMAVHRIYGMSVITALTVQNTTDVTGITEMTPEFLDGQLDDIFTDILPDTVKIGMVSSSRLIGAITDKLSAYHGVNIVVDPVMVTTSGSRLIDEAAIQALRKRLIPMVDLLTPNVPEAEILPGTRISSREDTEGTAQIAGENCGCAVLCKSGHQRNNANDFSRRNGELRWFMGRRTQNPNTHDTGYTLSSATASNPAKRMEMGMAVEKAKTYLPEAFGAMLGLGRGSGPMNYAFAIKGEYQGGQEYE